MPLSRRRFLTTGAGAALSNAALARAAALAPQTSPLATDPLRPQYHLMPARGWMNDPNGPIFWQGRYHLFFQVNPTGGADWGDISWAHAVSSDMFHWRLLANVMEPATTHSSVSAAADAPDSFGVFSGSAIPDGNRALFFYTAVSRSDKEHATLHGDNELREQQCIATASGPDLRTFTRQAKPLIAAPPPDMQPTAGFRDPSVWRDGQYWYMIVGSGVIDREGAVLLYRATVPDGPNANWTYQHPLITAPGNGRHTPDTVDAGTMWECPDFFLLDGRHVLLYSTERKVFWMTGDLDPVTQRFVPRARGLLDAGAYYAPKSCLGAHGERILWGWVPEKRDKAAYIKAGWSGCMALPRILHVDEQGQLTMRVPPGVDTLAGPAQPCAPVATIVGTAARLDLQLRRGGACTVMCGGVDMLRLAVHASGDKLEINGAIVDFQRFDPITAYIDASVIELFVGTRYAQTLRVYPDLPARPSLHIEVTGPNSSGTVRTMQPISPNRLT